MGTYENFYLNQIKQLQEENKQLKKILQESSKSSTLRKALSKNPNVNTKGIDQLVDKIRGTALRHMETMDRANHPSRLLNAQERELYTDSLKRISSDREHDAHEIAKALVDTGYEEKGVLPDIWQAVHHYASSAAPTAMATGQDEEGLEDNEEIKRSVYRASQSSWDAYKRKPGTPAMNASNDAMVDHLHHRSRGDYGVPYATSRDVWNL
jgi:uncharacterized protein YdaT